MLVTLMEAGCDVTKSFIQTSDQTDTSPHSSASPLGYLFDFEPRFAIRAVYDQTSLVVLQLFTQVIWLVIKSGYRPVPADFKRYKESWIYEYLCDMARDR